MKFVKSFVTVAVLLAICLSLVACSLSRKDVVGTWTASWTYNGNSIQKTIVIREDGTYTSTIYRNSKHYETETGTYSIDGKELNLHPNGDKGQSTPYDYKNGKLDNNGHKFTKK